MSRRGVPKSIYSKLRDNRAKPLALPILQHGHPGSSKMFEMTERVFNPRISRIQASIEALKMSAAMQGAYSLSSN